jgi:hypothetical protein
MATTPVKLYLARGLLTVRPKGYWFTAGAEKGSFGFYPHLKNGRGEPVYPDTQLHGDLKMASKWLKSLGATIGCPKRWISDEIIRMVFGVDGNRGPALLKIGDLEPVVPENPAASTGWFDVNPHIEINDESRTCERHMLVLKEQAYYGHDYAPEPWLAAPIYVGYFDDPAKMEAAQDLLRQAAEFLCGFGAARSRGMARGCIGIQWDSPITSRYSPENPDFPSEPIRYALAARVNFRNRAIEPGSSQKIKAENYISVRQLRGWFSNTYRFAFGEWPSPQQMQSLAFSDIYPSGPNGVAGVPPPMTTLMDESERVFDVCGRPVDTGAAEDDSDPEPENFFNTKSKPLKEEKDVCLTDADEPIYFTLPKENRIRNSMAGNFATEENGLFVQEHIRHGVVFAGEIALSGEDRDFARKAHFLISNVWPTIADCIFEPWLSPAEDFRKPGMGGYFLVKSPIHLEKPTEPDKVIASGEHIQISAERGFGVAWMRPRRNRLCISPGSVVTKHVSGCTIAWSGFGNHRISDPGGPPARDTHGGVRAAVAASAPPATPAFTADELNLSRAQAGWLRHFLNGLVGQEYGKRILERRIQKFERKGKKNEVALGLMKKFLACFESGGMEAFRQMLRSYLRAFRKQRYENMQRGIHEPD